MARTLCEWDKRDIERDLERLAGVIGVPRYVCRKCARSAQEDRHLCKPVRLPARAAISPPGSESPKILASVPTEPTIPTANQTL